MNAIFKKNIKKKTQKPSNSHARTLSPNFLLLWSAF